MDVKSLYARTMKHGWIWPVAIFIILLAGCAPSLKTELAPMQKPSNRGPLEVIFKPVEGMEPNDIARLKKNLVEKFSLAGFNPVDLEDGRSNSGRSVEIAVMKYEHSVPGDNECITVGVGSTYVCPLVAPCLLLRGYYHPKFEIIAEVSFYSNGRRVFKKIMSAESTSSANIINTGDEEFKRKLEQMTTHNFTVAFLKEVDGHESLKNAP